MRMLHYNKDTEMPTMDESHSAKKLSNLETSHIPVILLTAKNSL
jgi:CheY-like chemotaxis protein